MNSLLSFIIFLGIFSHNVQVAQYKIHKIKNTIYVDFVFEKDDIEKTLGDPVTDFFNEKLKKYLKKNFLFTINEEKTSPIYGTPMISEKHIYLQGKLSKTESKIKSIEITNTCLLNIDEHSNIIEFRLLDQERDFLMNIHRTTIKLDF